MKFLPCAPFAPDLPAYLSNASQNTKNVIPFSVIEGPRGQKQVSYGPLPSVSEFSSALDARCQGAYAALDGDANAYGFAGDASKLYMLDGSSTTWTDFSKPGGYNTPTEGFWRACLFGTRVIFTNFVDPLQNHILGSGAVFNDLSGSAPKARYCAVVRDWFVVANTFDGTFGTRPQRVWWSAINDATTWPTLGTTAAAQLLSDAQDLVGDNGWVQGVVGSLGKSDAAVFQERAVVRMQFSGAQRVFDFQPAEGVRGTPAPNSIVQVGSLAYYLGEDGWYVFDGSTSTPIGLNRVDSWFFSDGTHGVDQSYFDRVVGTADPIKRCILWAYPGPGNSGGNPNRLLIYNWAVDEWSFGEIEVETLTRGLSFGYTLDSLDTTGFTVDTLPYSLDSRIWTSGRPLMSAFTSNHKLGHFSGSNLAPSVDTMEFSAGPSIRSLVTNSRAIVDSTSATVAIGVRNRLGNTTTWGPAKASNSVGYSPQRANGLYARARIELPAGTSFRNIQGAELEVKSAGSR
jgi:hypothetical protein